MTRDSAKMQATETTLQHVNVKFFLRNAEKIDPGEFLTVFHHWIQQDKLDDLLIDVADYRHVPEGPGVILVAHNAFYSLDNNQGRLGLLFNRRTPVEGDTREVLSQALSSARDFVRLATNEDRLKEKLTLDRRILQISVNDRHFARNTDEMLATLQPDLETALKQTLGDHSYSFQRREDPRCRFTVDITADSDFEL